MRQHGFPPDKRGHFQVRLVVDQAVQQMFDGLPTAFIRGFIHMEGQAGDGFGDHAHTGVNGRNLNGRAGADRLAGTAHAEVKAGCGGYGIFGACPVPGTDMKMDSSWIPPLQTAAGLMVMAAFAKRLPVAFIPEQLLIAPMWNYVIDHGGGREFALLHTLRTQRMAAEKPCAGCMPLAAISPAGGISPRKQGAMHLRSTPRPTGSDIPDTGRGVWVFLAFWHLTIR